MTVDLKAGSLTDFFASAKETAREIDKGERVTPKNIIWVEPADLMRILKPERTKLVQFLRKRKRVIFSELMSELKRTPVSLNNDLKILSRYQLVHIFKEKNPGHGRHKVVEARFGNEKIEFRAEV